MRLFNEIVSGLAARLRDWRYPVVFNLATGESKFDSYQDHWVKQEQLDEFLQASAIEKTKIEARCKGCSVIEQPLVDGSVKLMLSAEVPREDDQSDCLTRRLLSRRDPRLHGQLLQRGPSQGLSTFRKSRMRTNTASAARELRQYLKQAEGLCGAVQPHLCKT